MCVVREAGKTQEIKTITDTRMQADGANGLWMMYHELLKRTDTAKSQKKEKKRKTSRAKINGIHQYVVFFVQERNILYYICVHTLEVYMVATVTYNEMEIGNYYIK